MRGVGSDAETGVIPDAETGDKPDAETGDGAVAQLGERLVRNEEVRGSIPLSSTTIPGIFRLDITMRRCRAITLIVAVSVATSSTGNANGPQDPTGMSFDLSRADVVMGDDIARTKWPARLARPSKDGQFEVLVRRTATPVQAPGCNSPYLVIRMPASLGPGDALAIQTAVGQKRQQFDTMMAHYESGQPLHFDVFAGPYGHRATNGQIILTACNLFFQEPIPPPR